MDIVKYMNTTVVDELNIDTMLVFSLFQLSLKSNLTHHFNSI